VALGRRGRRGLAAAAVAVAAAAVTVIILELLPGGSGPAVVRLSAAPLGVNIAPWDGVYAGSGSSVIQPLLAAAGIKQIRYGGGSYADFYDWQTNTNIGNCLPDHPSASCTGGCASASQHQFVHQPGLGVLHLGRLAGSRDCLRRLSARLGARQARRAARPADHLFARRRTGLPVLAARRRARGGVPQPGHERRAHGDVLSAGRPDRHPPFLGLQRRHPERLELQRGQGNPSRRIPILRHHPASRVPHSPRDAQ